MTAKPSAVRKSNSGRPVPAWGSAWSAGLRIWLEHRGQAVLGEGRADLLAGIERMRSISAAARAMKMSYRHAWLLVQAVNEAAGETFVESAVGGVRGGGARLTERGRAALELYQEFAGEVRRHAADRLGRIIVRGAPSASVVHLAAAVSLQEAVGQILTEYALVRPVVQVRTLFGSSNELAEQLAAGAPIDLFLTGDVKHLQKYLSRRRGAKPEELRPLARNGLAAIVPSKSTVAAASLKELAADGELRPALADPACPLGKCTWDQLRRLRIAERLLARAVVVENSRGVPSAVRAGRADYGIAFSSDAAQAADFRVLFQVPKAMPVEYFGAVTTAGPQAVAAAELLNFCRGDAARRCLHRCGLFV